MLLYDFPIFLCMFLYDFSYVCVWLSYVFIRFSYVFVRFPYVFVRFSNVFVRFSNVFVRFSYVFLRFSYVFVRFPYVFSTIVLWCYYDCLMIVSWFSYDFLMICLMIFLWCCWLSYDVSVYEYACCAYDLLMIVFTLLWFSYKL